MTRLIKPLIYLNVLAFVFFLSFFIYDSHILNNDSIFAHTETESPTVWNGYCEPVDDKEFFDYVSSFSDIYPTTVEKGTDYYLSEVDHSYDPKQYELVCDVYDDPDTPEDESENCSNGDEVFYQEDHEFSTATEQDCTRTESSTGSQEEGLITVVLTFTAPSNSHETTATYKFYYPTKVDLKVGGQDGTYEFYDYESPPAVTCKKWYGPSGNYNETDCGSYGALYPQHWVHQSGPFKKEEGSTSEYIQVIYFYKSPTGSDDAKDSAFARSYVAQSAEFKTTFSESDMFIYNVYTGIKAPFTCRANYSDGHKYDVSGFQHTWSNSYVSGSGDSTTTNALRNEIFIGNDRYIHTDPRGVQYNNGKLGYRTFYGVNPLDAQYSVSCSFLASDYGEYYFTDASIHDTNHGPTISSQPDTAVSTSGTTTLHGIASYRFRTTGNFYDINGTGNYVAYDEYAKHGIARMCVHPDTNIALYVISPTECPHGYQDYGDTTLQYFDFNTFITAHWYDFFVEIQYTDGSDGNPNNAGTNSWRDITNVEEVFFSAQPWYDDNPTPQSWFTNMGMGYNCIGCTEFNGHTGEDHRIPTNGFNGILFRYLDDQTNDEYYEVTRGISSFWSHSILGIKIRGADSGTFQSRPLDGMTFTTDPDFNRLNTDSHFGLYTVDQDPWGNINYGDTIDYTGWVIWSDDPIRGTTRKNPWDETWGEPEDWTNHFTWYGDELLDDTNDDGQSSNVGTTADYKFDNRGLGDYRTISIEFSDTYTQSYTDDSGNSTDYLTDANRTYWERYYDQLIVKILDDCGGDYYAIYGCPVPENWQTYDFESQTNDAINFLPPSYIYGYPSWNANNNPYRYLIDIFVTGQSNGTGNQ